MFDTDLYLSDELIDNYSKIYLVENKNDTRSIKLCENVQLFKTNLLNNINSSSDKISIITDDQTENLFKSNHKFDVIYPAVGENLDYLNKLKDIFDLDLNIIFRREDAFCWEFSNKGYFNFKKIFQKLLVSF